MLPAPVSVALRFTGGPSFGNVFVLGDPLNGILGTNVLGTQVAVPVDVTELVQQVSIRRGRNDVVDSYNNGTAVVQILDLTGDYNPDNSDGPYFGQILPNRQIRISAEYEGVSRFLFSGYVEQWDYKWNPGFDAAIVTITASDAFRLFNLADITTVAGSAAGDTTGERINQLLDAANWPKGQRQVDVGGETIQNDSGDVRASLAALQQVEATELGAFYMDRSGNARFDTAAGLATIAGETPTVFSDTGVGIAYQQLDVVLNDQLLANEVTVQRAGGTAQTVSDASSITEFFKRSLTRTDTLHVDDDDALAQAQTILDNRKTVSVEVKQLQFEMISNNTARINAGLDLEFNKPIQVTRTQPGGSTITATLVVQGIEHNIGAGRHTVSLTTSRPLALPSV